MGISTYHIHNILRTYSKQLSQGRTRQDVKGGSGRKGSDWISISARTRRKAVIDKVTSDIVNRIIRKSPRDDTPREISRQVRDQTGNGLAVRKEDSELVFKVIDKERGEETKTFLIEDSELLKDELQEITTGKADS